MAGAGITREVVEWVLLNSQWMPATTGNTRYDSMVNGRRLCVVVAEEWSEPLIITAFWFRGESE